MNKLPQPNGIGFDMLDELTLLACLIAGEARGEPFTGKVAVGWVVRNRVESEATQWFGDGYRGVILKPFQFSAFNKDDPNCEKIRDPVDSFGDEVWAQCYSAAAAAYFGLVSDPTGGADHYHTTNIRPKWADNTYRVKTIGGHVFYKLRKVV